MLILWLLKQNGLLIFYVNKKWGNKMLCKISKRTLGKGIILMNILTTIYFLLVVCKILPYNAISGGNLTSYQDAVKTSFISIFGIITGLPLIVIATELKNTSFFKTWFWLMFVSSCIDIINNITGVTLFQKSVLFLIAVVQAILFLNLATGMIKKISKKNAGIGIIITYIFIIVIYLMAIFKVLPYNLITGEMVTNHQIVVVISIVSIFVTSISIPAIEIASGIKGTASFKVWFRLMFVFLCINTLENLAGVTLFEKIGMGAVTAIEAVLFLCLAVNKDN